jgi:hypothetical protein
MPPSGKPLDNCAAEPSVLLAEPRWGGLRFCVNRAAWGQHSADRVQTVDHQMAPSNCGVRQRTVQNSTC